MNKQTLLVIVGILIALLVLGCSKKHDPTPHKQSDYVGTYDFSVDLHQLRFIVRSNFSIDNGVIDGVGSETSIINGTDGISRVELSNTILNLDFVINDIHYAGNIVQGTVTSNGVSKGIITFNKY